MMSTYADFGYRAAKCPIQPIAHIKSDSVYVQETGYICFAKLFAETIAPSGERARSRFIAMPLQIYTCISTAHTMLSGVNKVFRRGISMSFIRLKGE